MRNTAALLALVTALGLPIATAGIPSQPLTPGPVPADAFMAAIA